MWGKDQDEFWFAQVVSRETAVMTFAYRRSLFHLAVSLPYK